MSFQSFCIHYSCTALGVANCSNCADCVDCPYTDCSIMPLSEAVGVAIGAIKGGGSSVGAAVGPGVGSID